MDSLYVIEPGCSLRREGSSIRIMRGREVVEVIPAEGLRQLTLTGRVSLSGPVLDFLLENNIDTVFMTPGGRFRGRLLMDRSSHVTIRQRQYVRLHEDQCRLAVARSIVEGKLTNQLRLLLKERAGRKPGEEVRQTAVQIRALRARLPQLGDVGEIRGVEGFASRLYFSVFGLLIANDEFSFTGRNRRPPRDPVNGLLSFVYTLFTNTIQSAIQQAGLDPYLGALHETVDGRPSLACDLVEEWRGFAERLVLRLINRRMVRREDFVITGADDPEQQEVLMKPEVVRALITSYHRLLEQKLRYPRTGEQTRLRWIMYLQSRHFAQALGEEEGRYQPFLLSR